MYVKILITIARFCIISAFLTAHAKRGKSVVLQVPGGNKFAVQVH